jgi:putative alpha-1,2-mannosidase
MTSPYLFQDADGRYRGQDRQIHETKSFEMYTVFSIWDTYRALHPLLALIDRKRTSDFVNTFHHSIPARGHTTGMGTRRP